MTDARTVTSEWGAAAAALGWTARDLFGVHRGAPLARYDFMGLVPLLRARPVVALTADEAAIETSRGHRRVYRRNQDHPDMLDQVLLWQLGGRVDMLKATSKDG